MEITQGILVIVGFAIATNTFFSWKRWSESKYDQRINQFKINELVKQSKEKLGMMVTCRKCSCLLNENNSYKVKVNSNGVCFTENYCNTCKPNYEEKVITLSSNSVFGYKYYRKLEVHSDGKPVRHNNK